MIFAARALARGDTTILEEERVNMKMMSERRAGKLGMAAIAAAFAVVLCAPAQALNLVTNGSFETGSFSGWTQVGNTGFSGVQCPGPGPTVADGNCSAFFGPVGSTGGISQTLSLVVGNHYLLTFAWRPDGGTPSSFSASIGGATVVNVSNPPASGFQTVSFGIVATAANESLTFLFRDDPGFMFLDAVSVGVPEPASTGLLGIALVAMFAGLRRKFR
ncbi:MAG: PEP-CTERM sorting domain-containing protein [Betaproteobacteria bacterium]|nr:MAG: PEP-CTERM sorting domain-containing protein [Betaproteobacteria bacterium]